MKRIAMGALAALAAGMTARAADPAPVVAANTGFACAFYRQAMAKEGNLFFSPYSISTALAMTYGGARGETAAQMEQALGFGALGQEKLHPAFAALQADLLAIQQKGKVQLNVANSIWPHRTYAFRPEYVDLLKTQYGVGVTPQDYVTAAEAARKAINAWVEERTNRRIQDLIPAGVLDEMTRLVLANAIYFKGTWAVPFDPKATEKAPFHLAKGGTVEASLMFKKARFAYAERDGMQVLELPYAGEELSMVVVLPAKPDALGAIEAALTPEKLAAWTGGLRSREVRVFLPKFKMTWQAGLNGMLAAMGMKDAFTMKADFSGMDGTKDLYISAVLHKAFVEVNEEGTEAAAATGVVMSLKAAMPEPPPEFRADRPFLFLIRENKTGSVLFLGRVSDPTK